MIGPIVAGVVGVKVPRLSFFGQTVTVAEKMESTGQGSCELTQQNNYKFFSLNVYFNLSTTRKSNRLYDILN